jgi:hypothetical protein
MQELRAFRSTAACGNFPYAAKTVPFLIPHHGFAQTRAEKIALLRFDPTAIIYAVWPGQWASDVFIVDHDDALTHLAGEMKGSTPSRA